MSETKPVRHDDGEGICTDGLDCPICYGKAQSSVPAPAAATERVEHAFECAIQNGFLCTCNPLAERPVTPQAAPDENWEKKQLRALLSEAENELYEVRECLRRWVERANSLEQRVRQLEMEQS